MIPFKRGGDRERFKLRVLRRHAIAEADLSKLAALAVSQFRDERLKVVTRFNEVRQISFLQVFNQGPAAEATFSQT